MSVNIRWQSGCPISHVGGAGLTEHVRHINTHGPVTDEQIAGDLSVCPARHQVAQRAPRQGLARWSRGNERSQRRSWLDMRTRSGQRGTSEGYWLVYRVYGEVGESSIQPRWQPPVGFPEDMHQCRDEHRAHDKRVE